MDEYVRVASAGEFEDGLVRAFRAQGRDVAVVRRGERFYAFENVCSHSAYSFTGLRLTAAGNLLCGAHQARFDIETGCALAGPTNAPIATFEVRVEDGQVLVRVR